MFDFQNMEDAQTLAQAIVNTIPEPLVVLDDQFRVLAASRSFYAAFKVDAQQTRNRVLYALGDGQWDIPALRVLLDTIIPERTAMDGFEVEHDFPGIGRRTMLLNARQVVRGRNATRTILLAFQDITARRLIEREKENLLRRAEDLLREKGVLLQEMQHRVANSLQIIASILLLKARAVTSEETRHHLQDTHQRVMSVAEVQRHLHLAEGIDQIDVGSYLTKLCESLAVSMIAEDQPITVRVMAEAGRIGSDKAVGLGLIVTELIINAIKHGFPSSTTKGLILVTYEVDDADWKLTVSDNGIGKSTAEASKKRSGLGSAIVDALVKQLEARVEITSSAAGLSVSVTRATFTSHMH